MDYLKDLQEKNEVLRSKELEAQEYYQKYLETKDEMDLMLNKKTYEIATMKDEKGKAVYSNETLRNGALTDFKANSDEYKEFKIKASKFYEEYTKSNIEVNYLKNYLKNIRAYLESNKNEL